MVYRPRFSQSHALLQLRKMMIYKFKSQADGDVIMLEPSGDQMLTIIGRVPSVQGIVTVAQIPAAIAALEAAVISNEDADSRAPDSVATEQATGGDGVRLRARAGPFIDLLTNSAKAGKDVVWGV
jgi:cyclopropane-fatty-acyl-phospholipid synthase